MRIPMPNMVHFHFEFEAEDPLLFPEFPGSTIRGALGRALRRFACAQRRGQCQECELRETCPFGLFFAETPSPEKGHPIRYYALEPPATQNVVAGQTWSFGLTLFDEAPDYFPWLVIAAQQMGQEGIGRRRAKSRLISVKQVNHLTDTQEEVYSNNLIKQANVAPQPEEVTQKASAFGSEVSLLTVTPLALHFHRISPAPLTAEVLITNIIRRLRFLVPDLDKQMPSGWWKEAIKRTKEVEACDWTKIVQWKRFSHRQSQAVPMAGRVGMVRFTGNITELIPLLIVGELLQVGRHTTFGLGQYRLV